jgi:transposase
MNDATWIADLLAQGLIRASFVPPQAIPEVRDLTRTRKQLTREIVQHTQRIQAVLEEANIKLSSVITNILGMSGRRILQAIVAGESDPMRLAELGGPRLAATTSQLTDALHGRVRPHHQFLIGQHLKTSEQLEETITAFDKRIEAALEPFRDAIERLKEVPGLSETSAQILLAEIGTDMRQLPTARHLLSWAGLTPRLDESAGKRRSTRVRKGAPWLKPALVQRATVPRRILLKVSSPLTNRPDASTRHPLRASQRREATNTVGGSSRAMARGFTGQLRTSEALFYMR